ncbi:ABC transporter, periplasmic substrate-binding protein [Syntrophotalea carbinolica DSM 2380]|uniref:ABC transporter, periplasmic substrate-binding protein n=1 Tax=Syntrophotalea carbinolica (strain DSM 2380 / NBRC 103641 / GraBd1) TaxID=338963 RepID=Q3A5U2_SYNC1|nr:PhnD/SsuA/transferrin family substrate-binding protein [Syntrophotalea carbinolica]ABA88265.1 ABC transporter, periplasmic substrate-binding protein [Syntrophotalea carbinolica DSM 2380]
MFSQVNENDARAAIKVWIMTVAKDKNIPVDPDPHIQHSVDDLIQFGQNNAVDGFGLTTPEFPHLNRKIKIDRLALGVHKGKITEEYLILVRQDSGIKRVEQLRGRSINLLSSPRMSLALLWLDTILLESRQGQASIFFGTITRSSRPAQVTLPVFFGKTDACVISRTTFELMGELNPQLKHQLKILAASPAVIPTGFAFRAKRYDPIDSRIIEAMEQLGNTPAGRQILALTQSEHIKSCPVSCLNESLQLLNRYQRLCRTNGIKPSTTYP